MKAITSITLTVLLSLAACGGDGDNPNEQNPDANMQTEWQELITGNWSIPPQTEGYKCVRKTLTEDTFITGFSPIAPLGTHHTVLTIGSPTTPDGITDCNAGTNADAMLFGSGVGTNDLVLPEGVAFRASAGQQLLLNLHLFNIDSAPLSGKSGIEFTSIPESEVTQLGESILAGPPQFTLSDSTAPQTIKSGCLMNGDVTLLAIMPHMHQLGTHMKVTIPAEGTTLLDTDYSFESQTINEFETPLELAQGTRLLIECTYLNDTGAPVSWGDSSNAEMCFAGLFRYPAFGGDVNIICWDGTEN